MTPSILVRDQDRLCHRHVFVLSRIFFFNIERHIVDISELFNDDGSCIDDVRVRKIIDDNFPIRVNGKPSYRKHQVETITKILSAFASGKKFVCVDAPPGSGKSPINYTVCKIIGNAAYLTPQKQLQDQIMREGWSDTTSLKGKNAYACNYTDGQVSCNYRGYHPVMCNNVDSIPDKSNIDSSVIVGSIKSIVKRFASNKRDLARRTIFSPGDDIQGACDKLAEWAVSKFIPRGIKLTNPLQTAIGCKMGPHECACKSSRTIAEISKIRVLNPDVYYYAAKNIIGDVDVMVIDECHTLESCVSRIFGKTIPIDTIKNAFGIDLSSLRLAKNPTEFEKAFEDSYKLELGPAICASKVFDEIGSAVAFENQSQILLSHTRNEYFEEIKKISRYWDGRSIPDVAMAAMSTMAGEIKSVDPRLLEFAKLVDKNFKQACLEAECEPKIDLMKSIIPACKRFPNVEREPDDTKRLRKCFVHLSRLSDSIKDFFFIIKKIIELKSNGFPVFSTEIIDTTAKLACEDTELEWAAVREYERESAVRIVPISVPAIMNFFFYSHARYVLLTSGTWVYPQESQKIIGVNPGNAEFIKVESTFEIYRRPVYVIKNYEYTSFSEKVQPENREYVYKTEYGANKFCSELTETVHTIRRLMNSNNAASANIVIHCHTFDIAEAIAKYAECADNSFLIHIRRDTGDIKNIKTGTVFEFRDKDSLLYEFITRPRSGTVFVSPSVMEGVDFKDSIARAQIILKKPIPYMGDTYLKAIVYGSPDHGIAGNQIHIDRLMYTSLIQEYGRIVRSVDDWGYTIIFDQAFHSKMGSLISMVNSPRRVKEANISYIIDAIQKNSIGDFQQIEI